MRRALSSIHDVSSNPDLAVVQRCHLQHRARMNASQAPASISSASDAEIRFFVFSLSATSQPDGSCPAADRDRSAPVTASRAHNPKSNIAQRNTPQSSLTLFAHK